MSTRKLLTNGNAFKRTDNRWGGVVWYMDESGERKRKSFYILIGLCLLALLQYIVYRFVKKKKDRVIEQQRVAHQAELERQEQNLSLIHIYCRSYLIIRCWIII